jgi:NitT/TauT family transport system substrate-binding protein
VLLVTFLLGACGQAPTTGSTGVNLALGYIPNIQFAPLYVAEEKGWFSSEGIDIQFSYMDETQAVAQVGADELQFAVVSGEQVLLARAQGLPVVYVAAWYQEYPVSVVAMGDQGLTSPSDLQGKTIGLPGLYGANYIGLRALLHAGGLSESDVSLDSIGYTQVESLVAGRDWAVSVYTANEPVQLRSLGYELQELRVADYVQLASNGLITNEATIRNNPGLVRSMVKVLLQGIADTMRDPENAYQVSLGYVENLAQADRDVQQAVLLTSMGLWQADRLGESNPTAWENMQTVLLEMGLLSQVQDLSQAYSNQFLP